MRPSITIDKITEDPKSGEFVLYLVEDGPWPQVDAEWKQTLDRLQSDVLDLFDAVVDGGLTKRVPEAKGAKVRIQIDTPSFEPAAVTLLVEKLDEFVHSNREYSNALAESEHVKSLRIVTGHQLGRFGGK